MGQKNHEIVPVPLIDSIAGLKRGGTYGCLKTLLKHKLLHHDASKYDGFRLTYLGYDFLALRTFVARGTVAAVGRQIGVGKESDVFEVINEEGETLALKLHRLGRTSFRAVKSKRDYLGRRTNYSWLYLSRLAAIKEFAFMEALEKHDFPVPKAVDQNRHAVLMGMVDAYPFTQVRELANPMITYFNIMEMMTRLAQIGLIHCDLNEFNLMIDDDEHVTLIDFPQMVSTSHANAKEYFLRDVDGIVKFFERKLHYYPDEDPKLPYVRPNFEEIVGEAEQDDAIDRLLQASGFKKHHQKALEAAFEHGSEGGSEGGGGSIDGRELSEEEEGGQAAARGAGQTERAEWLRSQRAAAGAEAAEAVRGRLVEVHLSVEGSTGAVRCELAAPGGSGGGLDSGSSSSSEDEAEAELRAERMEAQRRAVQRTVVSQRNKAAKKAVTEKMSRNAMKNKAKKGRRGHNGAGKDGW
mmetsp:Transcript_39235/g.100242  ORF Transcript_39235/g.100242 Transcript_39235/m.100242 type:complete len:466 (-) Transcript_39235:150-1547(-)